MQSPISRTPYPPLGRAHAVTGTQNLVPSPLSSPKKASTPRLNYEALEISEVGRPFERKVHLKQGTVFTHYNCCWGPLQKQSSLLIHYSCCWAPMEVHYSFLHITVAIGGPFESVMRLLTHYICDCGPLWKRRTYTLELLLWYLWSRVLTQCSCCWAPL